MDRVQRFWDSNQGDWLLGIKTPKGRVWLRYKDLCKAFPGFKEIYTPEPDEPKE